MILKIHMTLLLALLYNLYIGKKAVFFIGYLFIMMHELSHMIVALLINVDVEEITLLPFGASAKYSGNVTLWQEFLIAIAGPLASLFFAWVYHNHTYFMVNVLIIIFNLLPIYPLDGGRIIKVLCLAIFGAKLGNELFILSQKIAMLLLIVLALYMTLCWKNYAFAFLSLVVFKIAREQFKKEKIQQLINYLQIDE